MTNDSDNPKPLPTGWKEFEADNGRKYYHNGSINKTTWKRPVVDANPKPPETSPPPPPPPPTSSDSISADASDDVQSTPPELSADLESKSRSTDSSYVTGNDCEPYQTHKDQPSKQEDAEIERDSMKEGSSPNNGNKSVDQTRGHHGHHLQHNPAPHGDTGASMSLQHVPPFGALPYGMQSSSMQPPGMPPPGMSQNKMYQHGMTPHGMPPYGVPPYGVPSHGVPPHEMSSQGTPLPGMTQQGMYSGNIHTSPQLQPGMYPNVSTPSVYPHGHSPAGNFLQNKPKPLKPAKLKTLPPPPMTGSSGFFTLESLAQQTEALSLQEEYSLFNVDEARRILRITLTGDQKFAWIKNSSMIARVGDIRFTRGGTGQNIGTKVMKQVTGEGVKLSRAEGQGTIYCADFSKKVYVIYLQGESLFVNGEDVLAFSGSLMYEIKFVKGPAMLAGGLFNVMIKGTGMLAITCEGAALTLRASAASPVYTDPHATVAWTSEPRMKVDIGLKALIGRRTGEEFQLVFSSGIVIIQPHEASSRLAGGIIGSVVPV